ASSEEAEPAEGGDDELGEEPVAAGPAFTLDCRGPTDSASTLEPLIVRAGDAEVRLCGKIDRIDRTADGTYAFVIDYKLGKPRELKAIREGKELQMAVYWLAVEQLLGLTPIGGAYDAMRA